MFAEAGYETTVYDPIYAPDPSVLNGQYDFITATEVFEHLRQPSLELEKLFAILKPGGVLGVMTKRIPRKEMFSAWHYIRDPTHICFYAEKTFQWIAAEYHCRLELLASDVCILKKTG